MPIPQNNDVPRATRNPHETKYNTGGTNILMGERDKGRGGAIAGNDPANDQDMSRAGTAERGFVSVPIKSGEGRVL